MHPATHALHELSRTFARLSPSVKALFTAIVALLLGFAMGSAVIGPILAKNSPDNAAAIQARFERRTVDPQRHYPEPDPYRSPTPEFAPYQGPALGGHQQAKREQQRGSSRRNPSNEAREAFGSARSHETSGSARATSGVTPQAAPYHLPDRHNGGLH
jgi:hypothetical protein